MRACACTAALLLLMALAACGAPSEAAQPAAVLATLPPATRLPTAAPPTVPPVLPTATPAPTATLAPSATLVPTATPAPPPVPAFSYPIGTPGQPPGAGFFIRHGVAVENSWYNPGHWHTGEDWYAITGDTAGAEVYAVAEGEVVYAGANYPGRVVIVRHPGELYSMYGHLDPALAVAPGDRVERGALLGRVLRRGDRVPNHLHFEIRTFLTTAAVNGPRPRYGFRCGPNCPPGPGYWPINAPDHPADQGWRNPTHVINGRMFAPGAVPPLGEVLVTNQPQTRTLTLWSAPPNEPRERLGELPLQAGERLLLLAMHAGPEDERGTGAAAYQLWYHIRDSSGRSGWVQAAVASSFETGGDGRPATIYLTMLPVS